MLAACVLALSAPAVAHAVPLGSSTGPITAGTAPAIVHVWGGCGWGWHPVPGHWSEWRGTWVPPHCVLNDRGPGWGGPYHGWSAPYWRWGGYPGRAGLYWGGGPYNSYWANP
jgi:hypothetical protein